MENGFYRVTLYNGQQKVVSGLVGRNEEDAVKSFIESFSEKYRSDVNE